MTVRLGHAGAAGHIEARSRKHQVAYFDETDVSLTMISCLTGKRCTGREGPRAHESIGLKYCTRPLRASHQLKAASSSSLNETHEEAIIMNGWRQCDQQNHRIRCAQSDLWRARIPPLLQKHGPSWLRT